MPTTSEPDISVPYFRASLTEAELGEVEACLRSGWLTTGPRTQRFETGFAHAVKATHAVALNSCTAALHLAVDALGLKPGQAVLVPTMTFAATAEVVRYQGAVPVLVDCDPETLNMDLLDAERKLADLRQGRTPLDRRLEVVGMIPVHVGGLMMDMTVAQQFAARHGLWIVEDAAHAFPAAFRSQVDDRWRHSGQNTAAVTCFSFYANKTITTGEGGMAVTADPVLAEWIKSMSLHGLTRDAWCRFEGKGNWDYRIAAPGYKYNLTDIAAALGLRQLERAEEMRCQRSAIAGYYRQKLEDLEQLDLPPDPSDRTHSWHLFPLRLRLANLSIDRNTFLDQMRQRGVGTSVHWRPLHLHPYYQENFHWTAEHLPTASTVWQQLISLPIFPDMREEEQQHVIRVVRELCESARAGARPPRQRRLHNTKECDPSAGSSQIGVGDALRTSSRIAPK